MPPADQKTKPKLSNSFLRHRNTQRAEMRPDPAPEACALYRERGDMCGLHDGSRSREEVEQLRESIMKRQDDSKQSVTVTHEAIDDRQTRSRTATVMQTADLLHDQRETVQRSEQVIEEVKSATNVA